MSDEKEPKSEKPAKSSAKYKYLRNGAIFTLEVSSEPGIQFGRTHRAKGEDGTFWDGNEAEFRAQFDKL